MTARPAHAPGPAYSPAYAWFVVFVLSFAAIISFIDRQIINLLVDPIKADLGINDTQMSLLQGFAFALFYAIMAIPLARLADSSNRNMVILGGVVCWSIATFSCGLAMGFGLLFAARMLVGIGEATLSPAGYSMLADYFPREKLSAAISVVTGSGFIGSGIAVLLGGLLIGWLNGIGPQTLGPLGTLAPWQMTFVAVSIPSILVVILLLFVREPARTQSLSQAEARAGGASLREVFAFISAHRRAIGALYLGCAILAAAQFGVNAWVPSFLGRTYGWSPQQIGAVFGPMVIVLSATGVIAGGWICNWMMARGWSDANLRLPIAAALIGLLFGALFPQMPSGEAAMAMLAPALFFGSMPFGAGTAALPIIAPNRMRAQIVALYLLVANLFGYTLGPTSIALVTDYVLGDPALIRHAMSMVLPTLTGIGALVLIWGLGAYRTLLADQAQAASAAQAPAA